MGQTFAGREMKESAVRGCPREQGTGETATNWKHQEKSPAPPKVPARLSEPRQPQRHPLSMKASFTTLTPWEKAKRVAGPKTWVGERSGNTCCESPAVSGSSPPRSAASPSEPRRTHGSAAPLPPRPSRTSFGRRGENQRGTAAAERGQPTLGWHGESVRPSNIYGRGF